MMSFWMIAGAMIAISVASVIVPLLCRAAPLREDHGLAVALYRSSIADLDREVAAEHLSDVYRDDARVELERRLVDETCGGVTTAPVSRLGGVLRQSGMAALMLALLPSAAAVLYMRLGDPAAVAVERGGEGEWGVHVATPGSLEVVVSRLAAHLRQQPDDVPGWAMLARSYVVLDRTDDAVIAYRRALALKSGDADLLADYADALATARGGDLNGEALQSIDAALAADPVHPKALALAASAAHERQDYALAIQYWERLEGGADPGSEMANQAQKNIDAERTAAIHTSVLPIGDSPKDVQEHRTLRSFESATVLEVHVRLSPALAARTHPHDQVYVYALADDGSRMPLAVQRVQVEQLPSTLHLDDSMAMTSNRRLSDFERVIVEAHVSGVGNAQLTRGDLIGKSGPVERGRKVVDITIGNVVR